MSERERIEKALLVARRRYFLGAKGDIPSTHLYLPVLLRLKYSAIGLAAVVAGYLLYALAVVPFIEPTPKVKRSKGTNAGGLSVRSRKLDHLFPAGSWELNRPLVLETEQGTLLFQEYKPEPDGTMKLTPCTVICYVDRPADGEANERGGGSERRPVLLQAPEGALLTFDRPFNLIRGEFGRLVGGRLQGTITISSPASQPGADDALSLVARSVQLDAQRIWTPHEVRFRYGPNAGSGRDLTIYLAGTKRQDPSEPSLGVGGVKLLELLHLDKLQLRMNDSGLFGKSPDTAGRKATGASNEGSAVDVTCQGPLRFDFALQHISLEDQVELIRHNRNGSSDQLLCQFLEIHFKREQKESDGQQTNEKSEKSNSLKLTPARVVAKGFPVIIRAASVGVGTRAEHVEYDCIRRQIWLKDSDKVLFRNPSHTVKAKELLYALSDNGQLGDLAATGPGTVSSTVGEPARQMDVDWQGQVLLRHAEGQPVLTFGSQVRIVIEGTGSFLADTLHLYLKERPASKPGGQMNIEPDRLHALGNVVMDTPNIEARTDEARLWLHLANTKGSSKTLSGQLKTSSIPASNTAGALQQTLTGTLPAQTGSKTARKFAVKASLIEALIVVAERAAIDRLLLKDRVELRDISGNDPQPLNIVADLIELQDGASAQPRAALIGRPAQVSLRGATAHGQRFNIYPAENVLHGVGGGDIALSSPASQDGAVQAAKISWKNQMHFNGLVAKFDGEVAANFNRRANDGETRGVALSDRMEAKLNRPIQFMHPSDAEDAQLAEFAVDGWGMFDVEMFDANGEKKLAKQMRVGQLTVNQLTGEIRGHGPGWLRGIHRGGGGLDAVQSGNTTNSKEGLSFLRVDFTNAVIGNIHQRQLEFNHGVKSLYGPASSWNDWLDKYPESDLPAEAVVMTCDRLGLAQVGSQMGVQNIELEAIGNAYVQSSAFTATGGRISYARAKDQLILVGDGRNPATLAFQKEPGAPPSNLTASKLVFWPSTRQFSIEDFRNSDIYDVGQLRGTTRPR